MENTATYEPRAKRQKKDKHGKSAAFERLKQLKGSKNKYEVNELQNVYDTVDEREYTKRVMKRQDDDWIVDDDGTGYIEDGRDIFDDDLDSESIAVASGSTKKTKKKKAVSENAGKGNLQYMLSNMPSKKKEESKLEDDDVLSELISEIDDNMPSKAKSTVVKPKSISKSSFLAEKQALKQYRESLFSSKPKPVASSSKEVITSNETMNKPAELLPSQMLLKAGGNIKKELMSESISIYKEENISQVSANETDIIADSQKTETDEILKSTNALSQAIEEVDTQTLFDDDLDFSTIEEFDSQKNIEEIFQTVDTETTDDSKNDIVCNSYPQEKNVFRFFWLDAYEDYFKQPGVVFIFGKAYSEEAKSFVSCCVAVREIERQIYLLPRTHYLDQNQQPTDKAITLLDVYKEFNEDFTDSLFVKDFKSRKVTKNFCFNPEVPAQSEYLEIRYSAKSQPMVSVQEGKTFSKVFGANSNFLEIFLLDRKIKGPCWLDVVAPEMVQNPVSWCKIEVNCTKSSNISVVHDHIVPPPLVVMGLNMKLATNPKTARKEIVMLSCLVHNRYAVDKKTPDPPFQQHFCVFTKLEDQVLPFHFHEELMKYKATKVYKVDSSRALLNYFITQMSRIDPDLIVGHDLLGYQMNVLLDQMLNLKVSKIDRLSRLRRQTVPRKNRIDQELFIGRLICDMKVSARELIRARSYDLDTLCQTVLKLKEGQRIDIEVEDLPKMYETSAHILKLISLTMQDTAYILKMMYELNVIPLALQITNIAGNVMSHTLTRGRSERNEFLLLHAFHERNYIVPDKVYFKKTDEQSTSKKKPTYAGGLVLEPKVGFYDTLILLMDFNSLYPSIIQEYNICFTTVPNTNSDNVVLPDQSLQPGILPTEIRKLVESRREVKKLMNNTDTTNDLRIQYHIRQMALKLTANSMYGCLGFSSSRFYAKNLAALVTQKGREILTNTKDLVEKMQYQVIYGDTDSIMVNTNCLEYDQIMKIGIKIKQEVNKLYRQVELDIDGVFKYLLLLKKKKYAAVVLTKQKNGELVEETEYKGLDIVRRDWSQLAADAGRMILQHILSEQLAEERIENIRTHLLKLKVDLEGNTVPLQLLVITKQLTKDPKSYPDKNALPHVQVALRYNKKGGKPLRAGDAVPYVVCDDGSNLAATQRAYHIEELKTSEHLKVDVQYYLAQQIHPVVSRICGPIDGIDAHQIAEWLGLDAKAYKSRQGQKTDITGENLRKKENRFRNVEQFVFKCSSCKTHNTVSGILRDKIPVLEKCVNNDCSTRPIEYLASIQNQLILKMRELISKYYQNIFICEDPACPNETVQPLKFVQKYPLCSLCKEGVMYRKYTEADLYMQLSYFQHIFDISKLEKRPILENSIDAGFQTLKETTEKVLRHSGYSIINLTELFSWCAVTNKNMSTAKCNTTINEITYIDEEYFDEN